MADDSASSNPPNINLYNVASDDALWVLETDHEQLLQVLAHPAAWVHNNVKVNGKPAILCEPFVVVFHEVPSAGRTPSIHADGTQKPTIHVKGIHETAVLTVRYSKSETPAPDPTVFFPEGSVISILKVGNVVHTHLELSGFSSLQVASSLFSKVTTPDAYFTAMNALPQVLNGDPTPGDKKLVFQRHPTIPTHVVFQGWRPTPEVSKELSKTMKSEAPLACELGDGDANSQGQVIVNGVIIKTYTAPP
jgi:hypothetical protein